MQPLYRSIDSESLIVAQRVTAFDKLVLVLELPTHVVPRRVPLFSRLSLTSRVAHFSHDRLRYSGSTQVSIWPFFSLDNARSEVLRCHPYFMYVDTNKYVLGQRGLLWQLGHGFDLTLVLAKNRVHRAAAGIRVSEEDEPIFVAEVARS